MKVTIDLIAQKVGVSKALVSLVINGKAKKYGISQLTCDRVMAVVRELNYKPNQMARSLRTGVSNTIGLIVSDISNGFYASMARQLEDLAANSGYNVVIGSTDENINKELRLINILRNRQVDGIILSSSQENSEELENMFKAGFPLVLIDRYFPNAGIPAVVAENSQGGATLAQHLFNQGFRNPLVLNITPSYISSVGERTSGFQKVFTDNSIVPEVVQIPFSHIYNVVYEIFSKKVKEKNLPDCVFAVNNNLATAFLSVLSKFNLAVPDDVALVCFDDLPYFSIIKPSITVVTQPLDVLCSRTFSLLMEQISNQEKVEEHETIFEPVTLITRESSIKIK